MSAGAAYLTTGRIPDPVLAGILRRGPVVHANELAQFGAQLGKEAAARLRLAANEDTKELDNVNTLNTAELVETDDFRKRVEKARKRRKPAVLPTVK